MDKKEIGSQIALVRNARGMTPDELARLAGISPTHLSRIERGEYMPRIDIIARIAEALNCRIEDFLQENFNK